VSHFDSCLGCMACMTACPSGVDYGKLIEATRAQIERKMERSRGEKFHRRFMFETFYAARSACGECAYAACLSEIGIAGRRARFGFAEIVAEEDAGHGGASSEAWAARNGRGSHGRRGREAQRVGLLLGCVQREFFSSVNAATARVLAAEGCEVVAPQAQPCCGALLVHAGEEAAAVELAKRTIDAFERANIETVVTNAAGCGCPT